MTKSYGEGDAFPDFSMETPDGGTVTKADLAGKKAVIFFYPKDNTPGCTTEAKGPMPVRLFGLCVIVAHS